MSTTRSKVEIAVGRLAGAFAHYDECNAAHAETTSDLTEAKRNVELAARAVVEASNGQPDPAEDVVLSGTTGGPVEGEYAFVEDPEAPGLCVCGWEIASPIRGHERRHAQYLAAVEDEKSGDVAGTPHKPARGRRKAGDLTAAVGKRSRAKGA